MARKKTPAVKATYDLVMSAPTVDAQNQLALLLLTYYRGIDTGGRWSRQRPKASKRRKAAREGRAWN